MLSRLREAEGRSRRGQYVSAVAAAADAVAAQTAAAEHTPR